MYINIDKDSIEDYFYDKLIAAGLCPEQCDMDIISDIVMDYLDEIFEELGLLDDEED